MKTHGASGRFPKEFEAYCAIRKRCNNPKHKAYERYGGRGIRCDYRSFVEFFIDVGPAPSPNHTIDRIDNNASYSIGNCRWATWIEQQNNRRDCRYITHNGRTMTEAQWCRELGFKDRHTIANRRKLGWPEDRLLEPIYQPSYCLTYLKQRDRWQGQVKVGGKWKYLCTAKTRDDAEQQCITYLKGNENS